MGYKVDPSAAVFPEGLSLLEVTGCEEKRSRKSGDAYFNVTMRDVHTRQEFSEIWMMEGKGQGMTAPKLKSLGVDLENVETADLLGRRMVAQIKHRVSPDYGVQAQIAKAWPEDAPPPEWVELLDRLKAALEKEEAERAKDVPF